MPTREFIPSGYVASKPRHEIDIDRISADSFNFLVVPGLNDKKLKRRAGQTTPTSWDSVLASSWSGNKPRGRQIIGIRARQLTDVSQHPCVLFTDDSSDKRGEVATLDSDNADWYSLGQEYGTTHYPSTGFGATTAKDGTDYTNVHFRWCPMWTNGALTARYVRGITASDRQLMFAGGRANIEAGEWLYGMTDASPWMWRKTWNFATGSGTNVNRLRCWGHQVPLFHPTIAVAGGTASVKAWRANATVYYSCAFLFEDGSIGPFTDISDSVAEAMTNGTRGRYLIPATFAYYTNVALTNIPRGGKGVIGRVIARTKQIDSTAYQATFPGFNDLRVVTIIRNNTQTTFDDYQGDDETLIATPDLVRIDLKWPRRGKYIVANDSRFLMCGGLKPNPAAIIVAPTGITASRDINAIGTSYDGTKATDDPDSQRSDEYLATPGTRGFFAELVTSTFRMTYYNGASAAVKTVAVNSGGAYFTLQQLVDSINQTTVADNGKEWAAHLAPGVDGTTLCNKLAFFTSSVASGDTARATAVGVSPAADSIWVRGPADPIVIYFNKAYMDTFPADDQAVEFTRGGASDTPSAILNWSDSKECEKKPGDAFVGRCLGAAPLQDSFIVFYERGIYQLKTGKIGGLEDTDMRLTPIVVGNIHVVADSSIFWGNGYAGCVTHQGVFVTDGNTYDIKSNDIYNHEKGVGAWTNEIPRSLKATQAGGRTSGGDEPFLYATVMSNQIHVSYRKTTTTSNDQRLVYDYSHNAELAGLAALKDGAWSSPLTNTVSVMAEIADQSGGLVRYGVVENVAAGRVDKFDTGTADDSGAVTAKAYFKLDFCDTARLKQLAGGIVVVYAKNGTGLSLVFARDQGAAPTTHSVDVYTKNLPTSGALLYNRVVADLAPEARTPADVFEILITDDGSGSQPEIWRVIMPYSVTQFTR